MPYYTKCQSCGQEFYGVLKSDVDRAFLGHASKCDPRDFRKYPTRKISSIRYRHYRARKHDPEFWEIRRNAKKLLTTNGSDPI